MILTISPKIIHNINYIDNSKDLYFINLYIEEEIYKDQNISLIEKQYIYLIQDDNNIIDFFIHKENLIKKDDIIKNKNINIDNKIKDFIKLYNIKKDNIINLWKIWPANVYDVIYKNSISVNRYNEIIINKPFNIEQIDFFYKHKIYSDNKMFFNCYIDNITKNIFIYFVEENKEGTTIKDNEEDENIELILNHNYEIFIKNNNNKITLYFYRYEKDDINHSKPIILYQKTVWLKNRHILIDNIYKIFWIIDKKIIKKTLDNFVIMDSFSVWEEEENSNNNNIINNIIDEDINDDNYLFNNNIWLIEIFFIIKNQLNTFNI